MEIVLFGGAFDPPHIGHRQIIAHLLQKDIAKEVWLIPTGKHQFAKKMTDSDLRMKMLELLIDSFPSDLRRRIKLEKCELDREGVSETYSTLKELSNKYKEYNFSWIIGADNLEKFHLWGNYEQMLKQYRFYVYPRTNCPMKPLYSGMQPLTSVEPIEASSTNIRQSVRIGQTIDFLVIPQIKDFIKKEHLYLP